MRQPSVLPPITARSIVVDFSRPPAVLQRTRSA
jgi:hypothetical protein